MRLHQIPTKESRKISTPYPPLKDYAIIGNMRTAALISKDGSIDWCCMPYFDSPAVFCRLLDARKGGWFQIRPRGEYFACRKYLESTNVLCTEYKNDKGCCRLIDFMPVRPRSKKPAAEILRLIEGISGEIELEVGFRPTFDYARKKSEAKQFPNELLVSADSESLSLSGPLEFQENSATGDLISRLPVTAGKRYWLSLVYNNNGEAKCPKFNVSDAELALAETITYWRKWCGKCSYEGPYQGLVRRSALALKLLTFEPTGALIAAPTTSLPEEIGGIRNWDYRFTWLRDSALILSALMQIGYHDEADRFYDWLEAACLNCRSEPQIMYTIHGGADLPEQILDYLEGYRASKPVRIGNSASTQRQLDVYGSVLDAVSYCFDKMPRPMDEKMRESIRLFAAEVLEHWREADHGIWEIRGKKQPFLYSKLLCWVALDRAVGLAETNQIAGDIKLWCTTRDEIRETILREGYDQRLGSFTQSLGSSVLDASALVMPLVGFLPVTDPRILSTIEKTKEQLTRDGLVYRYLEDDGLPGREAAFALCTFWLIDNLALLGRTEDARELFERVTGYANDVGLMSEEINPISEELLGNFPQGFTHLALIRSAMRIEEAEKAG